MKFSILYYLFNGSEPFLPYKICIFFNSIAFIIYIVYTLVGIGITIQMP